MSHKSLLIEYYSFSICMTGAGTSISQFRTVVVKRSVVQISVSRALPVSPFLAGFSSFSSVSKAVLRPFSCFAHQLPLCIISIVTSGTQRCTYLPHVGAFCPSYVYIVRAPSFSGVSLWRSKLARRRRERVGTRFARGCPSTFAYLLASKYELTCRPLCLFVFTTFDVCLRNITKFVRNDTIR